MDYLDDEQAPKKSVAHHGWKKKVILLPNQAFMCGKYKHPKFLDTQVSLAPTHVSPG